MISEQIAGLSYKDKIKSIIAEQLGVKVEEAIPTASFIDDLGADSLDLVEIILEIENAYNIDIDDSELDNLKSVQDIIDEVTGIKPRTIPNNNGSIIIFIFF